MDDIRPKNCRFRLKDEGKAAPRSSCDGCGKGIATGLGKHCTVGKEQDGEAQEDTSRVHHREYERGLKDAIIWLVGHNSDFKPEFLAGALAEDLL
jgi:hypothetical protein